MVDPQRADRYDPSFGVKATSKIRQKSLFRKSDGIRDLSIAPRELFQGLRCAE